MPFGQVSPQPYFVTVVAFQLFGTVTYRRVTTKDR